MASSHTSPIDLSDDDDRRAPNAPIRVVPNVLAAMMAKPTAKESAEPKIIRDRCKRLEPQYNEFYDPFKPHNEKRNLDYSPYDFDEPLFDDRKPFPHRFPRGMVLAGASKKARTLWVWKLGYALSNTKKAGNPTYWCCKLCHHDEAFSQNLDFHFNANTLDNAKRHLYEKHLLDDGGDIWRQKSALKRAQASGTVDGAYDQIIPFRQQEFVNAFMEWIICDGVKHRKATSKRLIRCFKIANIDTTKAVPSSHSTVENWLHEYFKHFEPEIIEEIRNAKSKISITFDGWGSKKEKISLLGVVVHFINSKYEGVTRLIGLPELPGHGKTGVEQCSILLPLLEHFGINKHNLGYFVLDNATNNDTTLQELGRQWGFDPTHKRLRCMGHVFNLIAGAYLFGQDEASFDTEYKEAGPEDRRKLWRRRREVGKLHNLVQHVLASGKRTELFMDLQKTLNTGVAEGKEWKLVVDGGVRWNATYSMIRRGLELREALDRYAFELRVSSEPLDQEIFNNDYLSPTEWESLDIIMTQLEPLFRLTKDLEGNADLQEDSESPSHGALWETLLCLEHILGHFEALEIRAKRGEFNEHKGIQQSITLAWEATLKWYKKTDDSVAWQASIVLHPGFKWSFFEKNWTGNMASFVTTGKANFKRLWEDEYKSPGAVRASLSPEPAKAPAPRSLLRDIVINARPTPKRVAPTISGRRDQYYWYLQEGPVDGISALQYWKEKEKEWPELAVMAFDFLAIPAMSSECERIFSSCAKQTTAESSQLSGKTLWHQECLKNWVNRRAINFPGAYKAVLLDV